MTKTCEVCQEEKPLIRYMATMMCGRCMQTEMNAQKQIDDTAHERVEELKSSTRHANLLAEHDVKLDLTEGEAMEVLDRQLKVDERQKVDTDKFNASTVSIIEMKAAIDAIDSIENKTLELFTRLRARFDKDTEIIFKCNQVTAQAANDQRSIQQYFNEYGNKLREDEREKLRVQDFTYKVKAPTKPRKATVPKKKKYDREALAKVSEELGIAASTIQAMCVSFNIEPSQVPAHIEKLKSGAD